MTKRVDSDALRAWITSNEKDYTDPVPAPIPPSTGTVPLGVPGTWTLKWQDDFSGTSLDATKWTPNWLGSSTSITKPINSAELAAYDPRQVTVNNNQLWLKAEARQVSATDGKTYNYVSGCVTTYGKYEPVYGVFEARVFMPGSSASVAYNWPAFWLNGRHGNWPDHGENDIMENLGGGPAFHYHFKIPDINLSSDFPQPTVGWSNQWHVFGCEWYSTGCRLYVNGMLVKTITVSDPYPKYIVVNNAVSDQHGGLKAVPATYLIDYVRHWQ